MLVTTVLLSLATSAAALSFGGARHEKPSVCRVTASEGEDAAPAIEAAFDKCGRNPTGFGRVIFENETYVVKRVMNTTGLMNVEVDLQGTLEWDNSNITYWLNNSLPVGYQNQSSAWLFGGDNIHWKGYGYGTLNGNGQAWYDFNHGRSNLIGRPHQITIGNTTNSLFEGIRFINSQMWTMTVIHSQNVTLEDIYVNNTSTNGNSTDNTDGVDTIYADNITFRRWTVDNGDDSISQKANSTNILIEDCEFYNGGGIAIGSIGQYFNIFETIQNVTARNVTVHSTAFGAYIKTWTGIQKGYPPNGGGGGLGFVSNLLFENFKMDSVQNGLTFTQCTSYNGESGGCDTSLFNIHNVTAKDWTGTSISDDAAVLQCSAASPCYNIAMENVQVRVKGNNSLQEEYRCNNTRNTVGFDCTGPVLVENPT